MTRFVIDEARVTFPAWRLRVAVAAIMPVAVLCAWGLLPERWSDAAAERLAAFIARGVRVDLG